MVIETGRRPGSQPDGKPKILYPIPQPDIATNSDGIGINKKNLSTLQATQKVIGDLIGGIGLHDSGIISDDQTLHPSEESFYVADILPTKKAMEALGILYAPKINIRGEENLFKVRKSVKEGQKLVILSNHLSNFDEVTTERALKLKGFNDICNNLIYLQGIRLDKKLLTKFFLGAFKRIKVWPPTEKPKTEEEMHICRVMHKESLLSSKKALAEGYHLLIYPEGGRSYEKKMKQAFPSVVNYIEDSSIILPISISGTEKILPVENIFPPIKNLFIHHVPSVTFGEPIPVHDLLEKYKCDGVRNLEKKQKIIDDAMKSIAINLPEQYRGVYADRV